MERSKGFHDVPLSGQKNVSIQKVLVGKSNVKRGGWNYKIARLARLYSEALAQS
jgi:hypothetical protein